MQEDAERQTLPETQKWVSPDVLGHQRCQQGSSWVWYEQGWLGLIPPLQDLRPWVTQLGRSWLDFLESYMDSISHHCCKHTRWWSLDNWTWVIWLTQPYSVLLCPARPTVPLSSILCYRIAARTDRTAVGPQRWEDTAPSLLVFLVFWRYMRWIWRFVVSLSWEATSRSSTGFSYWTR